MDLDFLKSQSGRTILVLLFILQFSCLEGRLNNNPQEFGSKPYVILQIIRCMLGQESGFCPTKISGFSPASGEEGDSVIITGTNFDPLPQNNIVQFNGVNGIVTAAQSTQLTVTIPGNAKSGKISVTRSGKAFSTDSFSVYRTFLYVANGISGDDSITGFSVNSFTGVLTSVGKFSTGAGSGPYDVVIHPNGKFLFVSNTGGPGIQGQGNTVSVFSINSSTGALTLKSSAITGTAGSGYMNPVGLAIDPAGQFLYASNNWTGVGPGGTTGAGFSIDANTGSLSPSPGTSFTTGAGPYWMAAHPTGNYLYVSNYNAGSVGMYIIGTTGILTPPGGTSFAAGTNIYSVAIDPKGQYLYAINQAAAGSIGLFTIGSSGVLSPNGANLNTGTTNTSGGVVDSKGKLLFVTNYGNASVSSYSIGTTGGLTFADTKPVGTQPVGAVVHPTKNFVYIGNNLSGTVSAFTFDTTTGIMTSVDTFTAGTNPTGMRVAKVFQ